MTVIESNPRLLRLGTRRFFNWRFCVSCFGLAPVAAGSALNVWAFLKDRDGAYIIGTAQIIMGSLIVVEALVYKTTIECIFDKRSKRLLIESGNIFRSTCEQCPLSYVACLKLYKSRDGDGDTIYKTCLVFKSGREVVLRDSSGLKAHKELKYTIERFLYGKEEQL